MPNEADRLRELVSVMQYERKYGGCCCECNSLIVLCNSAFIAFKSRGSLSPPAVVMAGLIIQTRATGRNTRKLDIIRSDVMVKTNE